MVLFGIHPYGYTDAIQVLVALYPFENIIIIVKPMENIKIAIAIQASSHIYVNDAAHVGGNYWIQKLSPTKINLRGAILSGPSLGEVR
jgi:hypothetical protein